MADQPAHGVHFVGSIPNVEPEALFRQSAEVLGDRLSRIPDGEYGIRAGWVLAQVEQFAAHPQLEVRPVDGGGYGPPVQVFLKEGVQATDVVFNGVGYLEPAVESFAIFDRLQKAGEIPAGWKFQVSLPTPLATLLVFVDKDLRPDLEPVYEAAMINEAAAIADAIPHDRLAIQWDTAVEFGLLENQPGTSSWFDDDRLGGILDRLTRLGNAVPDDVELGFHLCYGDFGHKHFKDPEDAGLLVEVANGISERIPRPISWIHMPVVRERFGDTYYKPLADLKLHPETQLYLGLVHHTDGVEGTWKRIRAAREFVDDFGVATECGMGRRPPDTFPELLRIHATVSEPIL